MLLTGKVLLIWKLAMTWVGKEKLVVEAATRGVLQKKMSLEISQNSQENTRARVCLLIKLQDSGLQKKKKRDSGTGICLWILWNF